MANRKRGKPLLISLLFLLFKDAGGMGDESPIDVYSATSPKERATPRSEKEKKTNLYFFNAHAVKLATLT